jgi:recombination protein RecA
MASKKSERSEIKSERIDEIKKEIEKKFGKGSFMGATDKPTFHDYIPTGCIALDKAIGIGGLPKGRIIEIFGPESSGKTTLALETIAQAHKNQAAYCAFIDAEHAVDTEYAKALGVDLNRLNISQPDFGEQALEITSMLVESGDFDVIVVDSVAALVPKGELEGEMGDNKMGLHSRLMSQAMRKLVGIVGKSNTILIFINQLREKIGVMFGSPETTTGGNALKYYASVRIDIRRQISKDKGAIMDGEEMTGNQVTMKVIKNKVAPPFKKAVVDVLYGEGFDSYGEVLDMAVEAKFIEKSGTWFSYEGSNIGQGREATRQFLKDNEEVFLEIKSKVVNSFIPQELTQKEVVEAAVNL